MHDWKLLRDYVDKGSQEAFAALVERHVDFVYSVCRREVRDAALAEDVTQVVFLILAQKAKTFGTGTILVSWLFQTARFAARNFKPRGSPLATH
jgi:DNA-directed RNA polymerase specialized sigma24 family protein